MWLVGVGGIYGCGCKEVYRFPHTTYPYSSCICSFLKQHASLLFVHKIFFFILYSYNVHAGFALFTMFSSNFLNQLNLLLQ